MPQLEELIGVLEAAGVGAFNVNIFGSSKASLPLGDGPLLVLTVTGGTGPDRTQDDVAPAYRRPGFQARHLGRDYNPTMAMAEQSYLALCAVRNRLLGNTWYRSIVPLNEPNDTMGPEPETGRAQIVWNGLCDKRASVAGGGTGMALLVEDLGGNYYGFNVASGSDVYPSGSTFDKLVPGSWPVVLNGVKLYAGTFALEVNARVDSAAGKRVKVGLFNLTDAPNTPVVEVAFTADQLIGERQRSASFTLPASDKLFGVKLTVNDTVVQGAAWGCRIVRV